MGRNSQKLKYIFDPIEITIYPCFDYIFMSSINECKKNVVTLLKNLLDYCNIKIEFKSIFLNSRIPSILGILEFTYTA